MITAPALEIVAHAVRGFYRYEDRQDGPEFLAHTDRTASYSDEVKADLAARRAAYHQEVNDIFWELSDDDGAVWGGTPAPEPVPTWLELVGLQERAEEFRTFAANRRTVRAHAASPATLGRRHLSVVPNV